MPDAVFDEIATHPNLKKWSDAYFHLSDEQKDYFDIENGFPNLVITPLKKREKQKKKRGQKKQTQSHTQRRKRAELDVNIKTLYHNVSDANFEILDKGFKYPDFKTKFPKCFEEPRPLLIHKKSLSEFDQQQLAGLLKQDLSVELKVLADYMLVNQQKGEQEGYL